MAFSMNFIHVLISFSTNHASPLYQLDISNTFCFIDSFDHVSMDHPLDGVFEHFSIQM